MREKRVVKISHNNNNSNKIKLQLVNGNTRHTSQQPKLHFIRRHRVLSGIKKKNLEGENRQNTFRTRP